MSTPVVILTVVSVVLGTCAVLRAEPQAAASGEFHPDRIHRPQDCAPPEQVIVPRPPLEARPRGSLIRTAQHQPRRIDTAELLRRKYDLYAGRTVTRSLPGAAGPVSPQSVTEPAALRNRAGPTPAAIAFWSFITICTLTTLWLMARVLRSRRHPRAT